MDRLPPASQDRFRALGRQRTLRADEAFALEGDIGNRAWLLLDGLVKVESAHPDGRSPILALRGGGELLGELGAFDGEGRSATLTAVMPTTAREFSVDELRDAIRNDSDVAFALLAHLTARLRDADRFRVSFMGDDVPHRLAQCLLDLADSHGRPTPDGHGLEIDLPLSQEDLAALVAASRDSVAKTLQAWRRRDLVSTGRRTIVLVDRDRFAAAHR